MPEPFYLVMTNVPPEEWCGAVDEKPRVIGRSGGAHIRIPSRFTHVSRRHAEAWAETGKLWIRDLGSRAGTHINSVWIEKDRPRQIALGDRLWLGGVELEVVDAVSPVARVIGEIGAPEAPSSDQVPGDTAIERHTAELPIRVRLMQLTPAELDIVLWLCRGYTTDAELGKLLYRSPNTVRTQVNSILRKLGLNSRNTVASALKRGGVRQSQAPGADDEHFR